MIVVIDYNVGNVRSVCNAFMHISCDVNLSCTLRDIETAAGLVLPGAADVWFHSVFQSLLNCLTRLYQSRLIKEYLAGRGIPVNL